MQILLASSFRTSISVIEALKNWLRLTLAGTFDKNEIHATIWDEKQGYFYYVLTTLLKMDIISTKKSKKIWWIFLISIFTWKGLQICQNIEKTCIYISSGQRAT